MSYFKAKMHQIRFRLGFRPRPRWGSSQLPRLLSWIEGATSKRNVKVFPYSLPSVGPGADHGVQAVSPQVT